MKFEIHTNIDDQDLTIESCLEIIQMLQETRKNVRDDIYSQFLAIKHLKRAIIAMIILLLLYIYSEQMIFIYAMPILFISFMIASIIMAEYFTKKTKKILSIEIGHFIKQKELLLKQEQN
jgi:hypothetical protein